MAETAVAYVLKELSSFLLHQGTNLGGELQREVEQVREVAYDTEDVLDEFILRFAHHQAHGFHGRVQKIYYSIKNLRARCRISSEMKNLKSRVIDISERHKRYQPIYGNQETCSSSAAGSSSTSAANLDNDIREISILLEEDKLVGIKTPKEELISRVLNNDSHLKVIAVVGMGGLGKTTLVRKVFEDTAVKTQFKIHVWLTISRTFDIMVILKTMIHKIFYEINEPVPHQLMNSTDIIRLSAFVKDFLQDRSYILVLDDVWSERLWDALKNVLPDGNFHGQAILTTRIIHVAKAARFGSHNYSHWMKPLSVKDSWTLFCHTTFQSDHCPPHLQQVSARILRKCEGLPLAIATIGGVLALKDKDRINDWETILRNLGDELDASGKLDPIKRILLLSYNDLPQNLKNCFLYLSIYPEDALIGVDDMLDKWITQGFVEEKEGMSTFDIANRGFHELVNRSLVQVLTANCDGIKCFRVHDFLRDMIVSKSREQNFITIAVGNYSGQSSNKVRRLALYDFDNPEPQELTHCFKSLRSLEFLRYNGRISGPVVSKFLCGGSKLIKVLDLSEAPLEDIPKEVFKLFLLKCLCLRRTKVRIVPKSIGKLQNLEILDLFYTNVTKIPVEILKLRKLHVLYVGRIEISAEYHGLRGFKSPDKIGKLLSLENLQAIEADNEKILREIGKLTKLRSLSITKLRREDGKELLCTLEKLTNLKTLVVQSIEDDMTLDLRHPISPTPRLLEILSLQGHIGNILQWVLSLQSLTNLVLDNSGLREDDGTKGIGSLQDLPNLLELTLQHAYEGEMLLFRAGGFRKLEKLSITSLERLKWLKVENDTLPSLQRLSMTDCKLLEELPLSAENLRKLESLFLVDMSDGLVEKVMNLAEQSELHQALKNIPIVRISRLKCMENSRVRTFVP
ncbi:disease resistance protein RPM1-like [Coffea arabica]|uniref:Disease resistance protein RPM1-like n=1 Tax=Coffea arabica TaxID=13443 RepID=A0A6P6VKM7_COFAR|nr:disease resistance protein RPM1-like [Coffea arabica]